jgi:hypothetical protein
MNWTFEIGEKVIHTGSPPRRGWISRRYSLTDKLLGNCPELYDVEFWDGRFETAFRPESLKKFTEGEDAS